MLISYVPLRIAKRAGSYTRLSQEDSSQPEDIRAAEQSAIKKPAQITLDRLFTPRKLELCALSTLHAPDTDASEARAEKDDGGWLRHARYWPGSDPQR